MVAAAALAVLAARRLRIELPLGWPIGATSREEFWRRSMPWPRGVQEDADIAWHVPRAQAPSDRVMEPPATTRPVPPTQPQPRMIGR